jgi:hypothetical protein
VGRRAEIRNISYLSIPDWAQFKKLATMRTLKQDWILGLFIIACILLLDNSFIIIPTAFLIYLLSKPFYIKFLSKFQTKDILIINRKESNNFDFISTILGIIIIVWGIFKNNSSVPVYSNGKCILGLFFLINGFSNTRKYLFVITRKSIIFNDGLLMSDWKLKFLNNVKIYKDNVEFIKLPQTMSFDFGTNRIELTRIDEFLKNIIEGKIIRE